MPPVSAPAPDACSPPRSLTRPAAHRPAAPREPSAPSPWTVRDAMGAVWRRCARGPTARRYIVHYEYVLGTSLEVQVVATRVGAARRAEAAALAEIDRLSALLSGHTSTSELARWQETHGEAVPVSAELAEVLEASEAWRLWTGGAFNPAAAHGRRCALHQPLWAVDRVRGLACRLTRLPVSLDAIAKGYIVDRAAACARVVPGVVEVVLNVGGDLRHTGNRALAVGVADPRAPQENAPPLAAIRLRGDALATSGGYRRGVRVGGRRVSHLVDPRTGHPADGVLSASVLAPDCTTADALSTAFSVLAPAESVALADTLPGVGCLLVEADGAVTTNAYWRMRALSRRDAGPTTDHAAADVDASGAPHTIDPGTRTAA